MAAADLATLDDVRQHLQVPTRDTEQDELIANLITRYSAAITGFCGREFAPSVDDATRRLRLRPASTHQGMYVLELAPYDLRAATLVQLHPETSAPQTLTPGSDYILDPENPVDGVYSSLNLWPPRVTWTSVTAQNFGFAYVDITGDWGFDEIPDDVRQACVTAVMMAMRGDIQTFGSVVQPNSLGQGVNDAIALPPGVRGLLFRYMRSPVF